MKTSFGQFVWQSIKHAWNKSWAWYQSFLAVICFGILILKLIPEASDSQPFKWITDNLDWIGLIVFVLFFVPLALWAPYSLFAAIEAKYETLSAAQQATPVPREKAKDELLKETVVSLIKRGKDLATECSKPNVYIDPMEVSSWAIECRTFLKENQTVFEQDIADQMVAMAATPDISRLKPPNDRSFLEVNRLLGELDVTSKRLHGTPVFYAGTSVPQSRKR